MAGKYFPAGYNAPCDDLPGELEDLLTEAGHEPYTDESEAIIAAWFAARD